MPDGGGQGQDTSFDNPLSAESPPFRSRVPLPQNLPPDLKKLKKRLSKKSDHQLYTLLTKRNIHGVDGRDAMIQVLLEHRYAAQQDADAQHADYVCGEGIEVRPDALSHHGHHNGIKWRRQRLRLAGARVSPKFHEQLRKVSNRPAQENHLWLYLKFFTVVATMVWLGFAMPVQSACEVPVGKVKFFEHWDFYLFAFPGVIIMFGTVPGFAFMLISNVPDDDERELKLNPHQAEIEREKRLQRRLHIMENGNYLNRIMGTIKPTLILAVPAAILCNLLSAALAYGVFGFPVRLPTFL